MLTISKPLTSGQAQKYHQQEFSNSRENYYAEGERIKGEWHGKLAQQWGLTGEVSQEHFARLAEGQHPLSGVQSIQHRSATGYINEHGKTVHTLEHRAGWDATFSAPKSVSLTALVAGDERVRMAHRESVEIALSELEKYVQARIGGYHLPETTGKWIAAKFEHDSSRPVNGYAAPQLHTHVVFFNMTERENGQMRALQPRELYRSQQYATAIYRSELALRLRGMGYQIEQSANGAPEIKGYTQEYLEASSPRRQQIKEHLAAEGINSAEAAQIAAHRTRGAKLDIPHEEMQRLHREMAERHGNQPDQVLHEAQARLEHNAQEQSHDQAGEAHTAIERAITFARDRNLEREAVANERELMRDTLHRSMGQAPLEEVQERFQQRIEQGGLIEVEQRPGAPGRAFTTMEMIRLERENIQLMREGQNQHPAIVSFEVRRQIEDEYSHLNKSQRIAAEEILSSRDQITGLEGIAGTGKTTVLSALRDAAQREGYQVEGFAPTSRAAQKLAEAGMEVSTLQRHLARGPQENDAARHLYILDEASLASTKQVNEFLHRLNSQDRVLLVGDVRQHQAVEAGRPYEQLQTAGMRTASLDEIVRQKDPELKQAVEQLARGEVRTAVASLTQQGRIHEIADHQERLSQMAHDYAEKPQNTLVISPDNESRRELNAIIHREMQQRGLVSHDERRVRVLDPRQELTGTDRAWAAQYHPGDVLRYSKGSTQLGIESGSYAMMRRVENAEKNLITVERANGQEVTYDPRRLRGVSVYRESERQFAEGDRVQFTAPSKELHVANRELGTITNLEEHGHIEIRTDSGRMVRFETEEHPHLDYGYAVTSHSSQGQTSDRVLIHVDTEQSEHLVNSRMAYVAVSRGRYDAEIYTDNRLDLGRRLERDVSQRTATDHQQDHEHDFGQKIGPQSVGHEHGQDAAASARGHDQSAGAAHGHVGHAEGYGMGEGIGE
jgi:conjugative relaxase-like TrwC/TraI family protein